MRRCKCPADVAPAFAKGGNGVAKGKKSRSTDTTTSSTTDPISYDDGLGTGEVIAMPGSEVPPFTIVQSADAPPLETHNTSFVAIQGEETSFIVHYLDPKDPGNNEDLWFMRIDVPADAEFVDASGAPVADGDTVEVTVEIDATRFFVQFGPHGSTFVGRRPAILTFNFRFADLNGLDPSKLNIWYQPSAGETWSPEPTEVDLRGSTARIYLHHFSKLRHCVVTP
jgi:hypothetical protein